MNLAEYRQRRGVKQRDLAPLIGLKYAGSISAIETGLERPSLETAMRIQVWSGGEVTAAELRPDLADLIEAVAALPAVMAETDCAAC